MIILRELRDAPLDGVSDVGCHNGRRMESTVPGRMYLYGLQVGSMMTDISTDLVSGYSALPFTF